MSGLEFIYQDKESDVDKYTVEERLCLTEADEDGKQRAVPEDHPDARWFYANVGAELPLHEAELYGLVKGAEAPASDGSPLAGLNAKDAAAKVAELDAEQLALIPDTEIRKGVVKAIEARKAELEAATPASDGEEQVGGGEN